MKKIVHIRLEGGLGNQLFQFAFGYSVAKANNAKIYLHKGLLKEEQKNQLESFLNLEGILIRKLSNIENFISTLQIFILRSMARLLRYHSDELASKLCLVLGGFFSFSPRYKAISKKNSNSHYYVYGNWMSKKYFLDVESDIRKLIKPFKNTKYSLGVAKKMERTDSVAVHIRLGDYLDSRWSDALNVCGSNYFFDASRLLIDKIKSKPTLFIFSNSINDINFIKKEYCFPDCEINYIYTGNDLEDLKLMSNCKNFILSNSTYGWWGEFFSKSKNTLAPKYWNDGRWDMTDIYNKKWIRVENKKK